MRGEQLVQCTGWHDIVTNVCVIAMVPIAVAAVAHKATKKSITDLNHYCIFKKFK
jgi:hypothetical protein